jgi:hypothetical protein
LSKYNDQKLSIEDDDTNIDHIADNTIKAFKHNPLVTLIDHEPEVLVELIFMSKEARDVIITSMLMPIGNN